MKGESDKDCNSRQFYDRIGTKIKQWYKGQRVLMTVGKYFRLIITLLVYLGELFLLLYSLQLLTNSVLKLTPFSSFLKFEPAKWLFDFLYGLPFVQSVDEFALQVSPKISENSAAGELIGAIGVGGMFITLLTGAEEQRICGVRTGELLGWLHKCFFKAYVLLFMPLVSVGIYAGHAQKGKAAVYAFLGVSLGMLLIMLACVELVLTSAWRERLALQYYNWQLHPGLMGRLRIRIWHKLGYGPSEHDYSKQAMLNLAEYLRSQAEKYHRDFYIKMVFLWIQSCRVPFGTDMDYLDCDLLEEDKLTKLSPNQIKTSCNISQESDGMYRFNPDVNGGFPYPDEYLSDGEDCVVSHAVFARDVWEVLLPETKLTEQDVVIIRQILYSLYYISQPDRRRFIVLLGLLFCLEDKVPDNDIELIEWVDTITQKDMVSHYKDYVFCEARHNLAWALLMILTIRWIKKGTKTENRDCITQFCQHFGEGIFQCGKLEETYECGETTLLWYAEWAARKRCGLSLNRYLVRISTVFGEGNPFPYFPLNTFSYRKRVQVQVLTSIFPGRDIQEQDISDKKEGVGQQ